MQFNLVINRDAGFPVHLALHDAATFVLVFKRLFSALVLLLFICFPTTTPAPFFSLFPLLSQCDSGIAATGVLYCLGAG